MRWMTVLTLLLLGATLSGCLGDAEGPESSKPLDTDGPGEGGNGTVLAPVLTLGAAEGIAPLTVDLLLDAPGFPDGAWSLDDRVGGDSTRIAQGTALPANVTHTFEAGTHDLLLTVSGGGQNATASALLSVLAVGNATGNTTTAAVDLAHSYVLTGGFAAGTGDPTVDPVPSPGTGEPQTLTFEVPADAVAASLWVSWDDGWTGNSPLLTDIDVGLFDGAGKAVGSSTGREFEYDFQEGAFSAGTWSVVVTPYAVPVDTTFTVEVVAWTVKPQTTTFTGSTQEPAASGTPADGGAYDHALSLPAGTQTVAAHLGWQTAPVTDCLEDSELHDDYDFEAILDGTVRFGRGSFGSCEFGYADGDALGGDWTFRVTPYTVAAASYTLTVFWV